MNLGMTASHGSFDDLLVRTALWTVVGACVWLAALLAALVVEALTAGRWQPARWTLAPLSWRRALLGLAVAVLTATGLAPAHADSPTGPPHPSGLEGLALPDLPLGGLARTGTVVVRPGDSLWRIVRRQHPDADTAALARAVAALYARNRALIGPDPDALRPGQRLLLPDSDNAPGGIR